MAKSSAVNTLRYYRDAIAATVLLLIFAYFLYASQDIKVMIATAGVDAKFFPTAICISGIFLSTINIVLGVIQGGNARREALASGGEVGEISRENWIIAIKSAATVLIIILYLFLIGVLGFVPASVLYLFGQICLLSSMEKRKLIVYAVVAVSVSLVCYLFFRNVFNLMLPKGIMPF